MFSFFKVAIKKLHRKKRMKLSIILLGLIAVVGHYERNQVSLQSLSDVEVICKNYKRWKTNQSTSYLGIPCVKPNFKKHKRNETAQFATKSIPNVGTNLKNYKLNETDQFFTESIANTETNFENNESNETDQISPQSVLNFEVSLKSPKWNETNQFSFQSIPRVKTNFQNNKRKETNQFSPQSISNGETNLKNHKKNETNQFSLQFILNDKTNLKFYNRNETDHFSPKTISDEETYFKNSIINKTDQFSSQSILSVKRNLDNYKSNETELFTSQSIPSVEKNLNNKKRNETDQFSPQTIPSVEKNLNNNKRNETDQFSPQIIPSVEKNLNNNKRNETDRFFPQTIPSVEKNLNNNKRYETDQFSPQSIQSVEIFFNYNKRNETDQISTQSKPKLETDSENHIRITLPRIERGMISCSPASNIAYLKMHKCASSAIQHMLFRYGLMHDLNFALPDRDNYFGKDIPFDPSMLSKRFMGNLPVNVFAIHTKWNTERIKRVMPNNTIYITSMREPTAAFESLFGYYNFQKFYSMNIDRFVQEKPMNAARKKKYLGYNQMAFDMGLSGQQIMNQTCILNLMKEAGKTFDLVLIAEKMEESLILLRHLFCWSFEDVVVLNVNSRKQKTKLRMKEETLELLKQRLAPDIQLYNHFSSKLEILIDIFGRAKMKIEIEELRKVTNEMKQKCRLRMVENNAMKVYHYVGITDNLLCTLFTESEQTILKRIRSKQLENLKLKMEAKSHI